MLRRLAKQLVKRLLPSARPPIDRKFRIDTSGTIEGRRLKTGNSEIDQAMVCYGGSQPSVIVRALSMLGAATDGVEFIDLGCGKGRALAAAGAFPFRQLTGIEIVPALARVAEHNLERLIEAKAAPVGSRILVGDATYPTLSPGAVLYMYNPFGESLVAKLLAHLEARVRAVPEAKFWLVYYNPVCAHLFDASTVLRRYYAEQIPFSADEKKTRDFSNTSDSVVIWQSVGPAMAEPCPGADRIVNITIPGLGADVLMD